MEEMPKTSMHKPIMVLEILDYLKPTANSLILDGTFGGGGHTKAILEKGAAVIALDRDCRAIEVFAEEIKSRYGDLFHAHCLAYSQADTVTEEIDGALLDLGISSNQLDDQRFAGRGFSFQKDEPLDLRFSPRGQSAADLLNHLTPAKLTEIFSTYAQDRYSKSLARKIVEQRRVKRIRTTTDLIEVIGTSNPKVLAPIWQALRIATNDELGELKKGLATCTRLLKTGGVIAVISFHSLEDAIVKSFFRDNPELSVLTKKPITPSHEEIENNPRSRSAKLRAARKIQEGNESI